MRLVVALAVLAALASNIGQTVRSSFSATAINAGNHVRAAATFAPVNTAPPRIGGTHELTATSGGWRRTVDRVTYAWERRTADGFARIDGADAPTFRPATANDTIRVRVTAHNVTGTADAVSETVVTSIPVPPEATARPTITGTPAQGATLTATAATWTAATTRTRIWLRCDTSCVPIDDTAERRTPTAGDIGSRLKVRETASGPGGTATSESDPTAPIRGAYEAAVLHDAPSAYYRLHGNATAVRGASGTTHGTLAFPAAGPLTSDPKDRGATIVPHGWATVANTELWNSGSTITAELWFRAAGSGVLLGAQNAPIGGEPTQYQPALYVDADGILRAGWYDTTARQVSGPRVLDGRWHHAVLVRRPSSVELVLDGLHRGTAYGCGCWVGAATWTAAIGSGTVSGGWLGVPAAKTSWRFAGEIDEVALYDGALPDARIAAHRAAATEPR